MWTYRVLNRAVLTAVVVASAVANSNAQDWVEEMFVTKHHDFGTLARGSRARFDFEVENIYEEIVHISDVRSSCGCADVKVTKPELKTFEKGAIVALFNTRSFLGYKNATITVSFDKPYPAQIQLRVSGFIRRDVVLNPGGIDFGEIELGQAADRALEINYAGRDDWKIVDVQCADDLFDGFLTEKQRGQGRVGYELTVRLKPTAKAGYITQQVILVTNDQRNMNIPFMVTGNVRGPVSVSPAALVLGVVRPGQRVTKQIVVRAKKPFRITGVTCTDHDFSFKTSDASKPLHLIPVTYTAPHAQAVIKREIKVQTDVGSDVVATCVATVTVRDDERQIRE